ncbi:hypothetical protein EGI16_21595 [Chryseobacterium sp. G0240]|uniref:hypothetical protein n=1 Tax=Chryseobacterium sp. G0240 TaxID=2487066 RepID=UPI000F44CBAE|nr:hypothetical protein [Chryseobacterium sp. G0240]ROH98274.1 hypothetical protein EGI16_21595 [Chryseobacterium sp. G0240]
MWYKLNGQIQILQTWVTFLRTPVFSSFLSLISDEISDLNLSFLTNRNQNITKIVHNSQVCKLRKILNDTFDYERRIQIVDGVLKKPKYIYTNAEQKPKWLGEMFIYTQEETEGSGVDFTVMIPGDLKNYQVEIKALIDFYKLAGKRYKIVVNENI